jgi:hypothetical protein
MSDPTSHSRVVNTHYIVMIRPVGSYCWTAERIAKTEAAAERLARDERNRKIRFADGSMHLQSTAIVQVELPDDRDETQQHYGCAGAATVERSIP